MISVNLSASCGATVCHITWVDEKPCSSNSGGPLPPTRAKMRPALVLIHSEAYPGNRSARSGIDGTPWRPVTAPQAEGRRRYCFKHCLALPLARPSVMPSVKPGQQEPKARKCHVDRFRNSGGSQGDPRESPPMGA